MQLKLIDKQNLEKDIYLFTFKPEKPVTWKAGQQMLFTLVHPEPDNLGEQRVFSIASAPFEKNIQILTHCDDQSSSFKRALREMQKGAAIDADAPEGDFVMGDPAEEHTFIAAGVGIAPFRAILMDLDYHALPINVTLIYSHTSERFPFEEEIEELLERHEHFRVFYTIDPTEVEKGRIKEAVIGAEHHPIYMSGVYIRKIATMLNHRDTAARRVVHDGRRVRSEAVHKVEKEQEEDLLKSLWGE